MSIGKIGEFEPKNESFENYHERLTQYFIANDVKKEKQKAVFLAAIGPSTYDKVKNLCLPVPVSEVSLDEIITKLSEHYKPTPLLIFERYQFGKRVRHENESIADFAVDLKRLSATCDFKMFLDDALCMQFVVGLNFPKAQARLIQENKLSFSEAVKIANSEIAAANSCSALDNSVQEQSNQNNVNLVQQNSNKGMKFCWRCGQSSHTPNNCRFRSATCHKCNKVGHIQSRCDEIARWMASQNRGKRNQRRQGRVNAMPECEYDSETSQLDPTIYHITKERLGPSTDSRSPTSSQSVTVEINQNKSPGEPNDKYMVSMKVDNQPVVFELDTAASVSIIGENTYKELFSNRVLSHTPLCLKSYSGNTLDLLGEIQVRVQYNDQEKVLPLIVAKGRKPSLLGRTWLKEIKLDWGKVFSLRDDPRLRSLLSQYQDVFAEQKGVIKGFEADIRVPTDTKPVFRKPYPVPYPKRDQVTEQLLSGVDKGVYRKVESSTWASPMVTVVKESGDLRLCGDYKVTVNQFLEADPYPLPSIEELLATIGPAKYFSKIDLANAFQQLKLSDGSKELLTVNTPIGLLQYERMPFGIKTAPQIFQRVMDEILKGIKGVVCYIDDILISSTDKEGHYQILAEVLKRLEEYNVHARITKCSFIQESVEYLGHYIDAKGIHPLKEKVDALRNLAVPENVPELRAYLGMVNYYGKYIRHLASLTEPLNRLLKKDVKWIWDQECQDAFDQCKKQISGESCLVPYDPKKPLKLDCDASPVGVGAVLSHIMEDGQERPIAFASRTLSKAEKGYAQLHKEALSLVFGVKKFHMYLYGAHFTLVTDHKPLLSILGPKTGVPTLAAARLQRWSLVLSAYDYGIEYRKSESHANADALSRLPDKTTEIEETTESSIHSLSYSDQLPITSQEIRRATRENPVLARAYDYTLNGWPEHSPDESLTPYFRRRHELATEDGCLLWGLRVVIPPTYRHRLLTELHEEHHGIVRMKSLARCYLWWPGLDHEIEELVQDCDICQSTRRLPAEAPLLSWAWPTRPWQRVHVDFAEKGGVMFFILIDAHSKWIEVTPMSSTTAERTIDVLRSCFGRYGLPEQLVSDNGPQFTSHEFKLFMERNGIKHKLMPPYHPSSNGAAERSVQIVKMGLEKQVIANKTGTLNQRLSQFLLMYRVTPHSTTGRTPSELFLKRELRTRLTLLKPNLDKSVKEKQNLQKKGHDKGRVTERFFQCNDLVRVRNFTRGKELWLRARVVKVCGPRTYVVQVGASKRFVHVDHLIRATSGDDSEQSVKSDLCLPRVNIPTPVAVLADRPPTGTERVINTETVPNSEPVVEKQSPGVDVTLVPGSPLPTSTNSQQERRYPIRQRKTPQRLDL